MSVTDGISIGEARKAFADLLNRVMYGGERIVLTRRDRPVAAIVSVEDYELLEQLRAERFDLTSTGPSVPGSGGVPAEPLRIAAELRPPGPPRRPGFRA